MAIDVVITCPLGSTCEEIVDGKIHRCAWYTEMKGIDAQGEEQNDWKCAMTWMPILQTEVAGTQRGVAASINSMRNENVKRQDLALKAMNEANTDARITKS
jgi:hypothetical protein